MCTFTFLLTYLAECRVCESDCDNNALLPYKAAQIVRKEMLSHIDTCVHSKEYLITNATKMPPSLLALVGTILNPIDLEMIESNPQPALNIVQLLHFNVAVKTQHSTATHHTKSRDPPLPVHIGLSLHAQLPTAPHKRNRVENMHALGLSVSYPRVFEISAGICDKSIQLFDQDSGTCSVSSRLEIWPVHYCSH